MTIGSIFGGGTSPAPTSYYPFRDDTRQVISEREGSGFGYGSSKRTKGKYKDKKHAAMSALTLLAFLFFLNILQNCLREQTAPISPEVTMMMMLPPPQKNVKGEQPKEGVDWDGTGRRKRSLLQFEPGRESSSRRTKFIRDVKDANFWPEGPSQLTEKELENQILKTDNPRRPFVRTVDDEGDWVPKVGPMPGPANQTGKIFGGKQDEIGMPSVGSERNPHETSTLVNFIQAATVEYPHPYLKYPQNHRFRYDRNGQYRRTKYPPNRRNWNYHVREKYYPVAVVERREDEEEEEDEEEFGFDLIKTAWKVLAGVAGPIARMIPELAKIGKDESQCYDLFVCEAHRIGRFMGPTAEIFASAFSSFLNWYLGEEKRDLLMDAVNSGREGKSCQEQILNCDQRAGGKSAITLFAQLLETNLIN